MGNTRIVYYFQAVYWNIGQYQEALDYYRQALDIRHDAGDKRGEGSTLNNIGGVYESQGQYEQALDYYRQALEIRHEIGDKRGEGSTLNNIGKTYESQEQYQKALNYYQQALTIRRAVGDKRGEGSTLNNIGEVYRNLSQYQEAYDAFQSSININEMLGTIHILWMAQRGLAAVEIQLNQPESAITHYEQALDNIKALRAGLTEEEHKLSFMEDKEIFERKQGRVFLEEMGKSGARLFAGLPESIKQREEQLDTQLDQIRQHLADERAKPQQNHKRIQELEQQKKTLQAKREDLQTTIKTDYSDYYALRYPQPADISELQSTVLQPKELILVYGVMQEHTLLWLISPETVQMYTLPVGNQTLQKRVVEVREAMLSEWGTSRGLTLTDKPETKQIPFVQASHALYSLLIPEEVRSLLAGQHTLNVVPTGPLYALPFEALVTSPPGSAGVSPAFSPGSEEILSVSDAGETPALPGDPVHYLIEDIPITYLSSASLLKTLREAKARRTTPARYPLLAFAHPVYSVDTPQETGTVRGLRAQAYRELLGGGLPELPETAEEAETVAELFSAPVETEPLCLVCNLMRNSLRSPPATQAEVNKYVAKASWD